MRIVLALVVLGLLGFGVWLFTLPARAAPTVQPAIAPGETATTLQALRPPKRRRPLIAIIGANAGTEITDYLMPYGILRRADVADVMALSTEMGPVTLFPAALKVNAQATVAEFDALHPDGADYVVVPAMSRDDDPAVLQWIRAQAAKGATILGVCVGATIVANAGLLDGKRATTHWYYVDTLRKHPMVRYVPDRRMVTDRGVATTTGITASMPFTLTLIEAIAGPPKAQAVAQELGVEHWDARHDSDAFRFTRTFATTAIVNTLTSWGREDLGIEIGPGVDEVALALVADAWSRTFRSRAVTFSRTAGAQESRGGIDILSDRVVSDWPADRRLPIELGRPPAVALEDALEGIEARYGDRTADFVAMQLEYPRP